MGKHFLKNRSIIFRKIFFISFLLVIVVFIFTLPVKAKFSWFNNSSRLIEKTQLANFNLNTKIFLTFNSPKDQEKIFFEDSILASKNFDKQKVLVLDNLKTSGENKIISVQEGNPTKTIKGEIHGYSSDGISDIKIMICKLGEMSSSKSLCNISTLNNSIINDCIPSTIHYYNLEVTNVDLSRKEADGQYSINVDSSGRYLIQPVYLPEKETCMQYGLWDPEYYVIDVEQAQEEDLEGLDFDFFPSSYHDAILSFNSGLSNNPPCLPDYFDWRDSNFVSPVKIQGTCGSSWAFATVGVVESVYNIEQGGAINRDLSEQNLVSNCYSEGSCTGGKLAFSYIKEQGIVDEACFPYQSFLCGSEKCTCPCNAECQIENSPPESCVCSKPCECKRCSDWQDRVWKISEYGSIESGELDYMKFIQFLNPDLWQRVNKGSVDEATDNLLTSYKIKIALLYYGPLATCGSKHCVMIVGWSDKGFIIKNSWGRDWGDEGFLSLNWPEDSQAKDFIGKPIMYARGVKNP